MNQPDSVSDKSYVVAVCLSGIFGIVGFQHFYLGRYIEFAIDFGMFILAIFLYLNGEFLWGFLVIAIDSIHTFIVTIMLLTGSFKDGAGKLVCYPGQKIKTGDTP